MYLQYLAQYDCQKKATCIYHWSMAGMSFIAETLHLKLKIGLMTPLSFRHLLGGKQCLREDRMHQQEQEPYFSNECPVSIAGSVILQKALWLNFVPFKKKLKLVCWVETLKI